MSSFGTIEEGTIIFLLYWIKKRRKKETEGEVNFSRPQHVLSLPKSLETFNLLAYNTQLHLVHKTPIFIWRTLAKYLQSKDIPNISNYN